MKTTILNTLRNYYGHLKDKCINVIELDVTTDNFAPLFSSKYQSVRDGGKNDLRVTREHSSGGIMSTSTTIS